MKRLQLVPDGFECKLLECPAGFFLYGEEVCFKSEYVDDNGRPEVYCESGEAFWGGTSKIEDLQKVMVIPLISRWVE